MSGKKGDLCDTRVVKGGLPAVQRKKGRHEKQGECGKKECSHERLELGDEPWRLSLVPVGGEGPYGKGLPVVV